MGLVRGLADDATHLFRTEVKLARAEVAANVAGLARPVAMIGVAALLGVAALFTLMGAFVGWLAPYVGAGWAALIVAAVVGSIAGLMAMSALKALGAASLMPHRFVGDVKKDVAVLKGESA